MGTLRPGPDPGNDDQLPGFKEAQKLLDENKQEHGETFDDQIVRVVLLATQPTHRRDAIRLCETLTAQQFSMLPEMQFFLAQQYEADGNWPTAISSCVCWHAGKEPRYPVAVRSWLAASCRKWTTPDRLLTAWPP